MEANLMLRSSLPSSTTTVLIPNRRLTTSPKPPVLSSHSPKLLRGKHRRIHCGKMFVPGFGEASPEAKAAKNMQDFFTYVAVKIVLGQLQSYNPEAYAELMEYVGRSSLSDGDEFCRGLMRESSNHKALGIEKKNKVISDLVLPRMKDQQTCIILHEGLSDEGNSSGDYPSIEMMEIYKEIDPIHVALRILEVRSAYSKRDFEWDNLKKLAFKMVDDSNTKLMREYILETTHLEDEE